MGGVFDELHTQPNRKLFDVMTKGSGDARMQPLYFLITTAGTDTRSICYETHQKAKDIIEGRKIDPTFYPVIYGRMRRTIGRTQRYGRKPIRLWVLPLESIRSVRLANPPSRILRRRMPFGNCA